MVIDDAISFAVGNGCTFVAASGNNYTDSANYCPSHILTPGVIVVGSMNSSFMKSDFSNYGYSLDLLAPGEDIYSTVLNGFSYMSGTSMATPHISALAAMTKLVNSSYSPSEIETTIKSRCVDLYDTGIDIFSGSGYPYYGNVGFRYISEISGYRYYNLNGNYVTGLQEINGYIYFFKDTGKMSTGWRQIDGHWYFFNSNGQAVIGLQRIGNVTYYFSQNGIMKTGWRLIDGHWYYFTTNGHMVTSFNTIENVTYYFNEDGIMQTGWRLIDEVWYYFDNNGHMLTGFSQIGNNVYYFSGDGKMQLGWQSINGSTYYFRSNGAMVTGYYEIDEVLYFFNSNGQLHNVDV